MPMSKQSTNHILMVEPASFYANPETMETNAYQTQEIEPRKVVFQKALQEFRGLRDALVAKGVMVTTTKGFEDCPDMVFPNCLSTHRDDEGGKLFIYPMHNKNRQAERDPALIKILKCSYDEVMDWTHFEAEGRALESTASMVMDRINKVVYAGLSARTDRGVVQEWCTAQNYDCEIFETQSHVGKPVYHTDCVMWIGSTLAGVCGEAIVHKDRGRVLERLQSTHDINHLDMDQLAAMCGNGLEVVGEDDAKFLTMSSGAYAALTEEQKEMILQHFDNIIHAPLDTLEKYGGGSARCMMMELF